MISLRTLFRFRRGLGLRPNDQTAHGLRRSPKDRDIDRLGLAAASGPGLNLQEYAGDVLDQVSTQMCVAHAVLDGEVTCMAARYGKRVPLGSRRAAYFNSVIQHERPVTDRGTYVRTLVKGLARFGIVEEAAWPFRPLHVTEQPDIGIYLKGYQRRGIRGYYFIFDDGDALLDAYCAAIEDRRTVAFGCSVDKAFTLDTGADHIGYSPGASVGGHAMQILGYKYESMQRWFRVKNSWGQAWRDKGYAWLNEEWILNGWQHCVVDPAA